jgi:hypothetical protein
VAAGDIKIEHAASSALTITLASLDTSTTLLFGRESTAVDNTTNKYTDYLIAGKITTGTSPTTGKTIEVNVVGTMDDTTWPDVFDGTDSAETITSAGVKGGICRPVATLATDGTSNVAYHFGPVSVAARFGVMPKKFVVFVTHNTADYLNSTAGNHAIYITPVYHTVAP